MKKVTIESSTAFASKYQFYEEAAISLAVEAGMPESVIIAAAALRGYKVTIEDRVEPAHVPSPAAAPVPAAKEKPAAEVKTKVVVRTPKWERHFDPAQSMAQFKAWAASKSLPIAHPYGDIGSFVVPDTEREWKAWQSRGHKPPVDYLTFIDAMKAIEVGKRVRMSKWPEGSYIHHDWENKVIDENGKRMTLKVPANMGFPEWEVYQKPEPVEYHIAELSEGLWGAMSSDGKSETGDSPASALSALLGEKKNSLTKPKTKTVKP